jgi:hypothetical protein
MDPQTQLEKFRKLVMNSSYCNQFGDKPKAVEDFHVVKQKKFRQLDLAQYIKPEVAAYFERWLEIGNLDEFVKKLYFTLREIHTIIKNY